MRPECARLPPGCQGLLAEFAGFKHLLRVRLEKTSGGQRIARMMQSTRCADNDRSTIVLTDGEPHVV